MQLKDLLKNKKVIYVTTLIIIVWGILLLHPLIMLSTGNLNNLENAVVAVHVAYSNLTYLTREWTEYIVPGLLFFAFGFIVFVRTKEKNILTGKKVKKELLLVFVISITLLSTAIVYPISAQQRATIKESPQKPLVNHIFVMTFDGARADVFWDTVSFIKNMSREGVVVDHAVTVDPPVTYPAHTSMFTGVYPAVHGVLENYIIDLKVRDIFEIAADYGYRSFIIGGSFARMWGDDAPNGYVEEINTYTGSKDAMDKALNHLDTDIPNIMFIHLPDTDEVGHQYGHDSPQYREAMRLNDLQVKRLFTKLEELHVLNDSLIIVTADHGMFGHRHHHTLPSLVIDIPMVLWSPVLKKGYHIAAARILDIAPTILFTLGIPKEEYSFMQGVALYDAFNDTIVDEIRGSNVDLNNMRIDGLKAISNFIFTQFAIYLTINYFGYVLAIWSIVLAYREHKRVKKVIREYREKAAKKES